QGHKLEIASPETYNDWKMTDSFMTILAKNTYDDFFEMKRRAKDDLSIEECDPSTQFFYELGSSISNDLYSEARSACNQFAIQTNNFFEDYDVLITPTIFDIAPE